MPPDAQHARDCSPRLSEFPRSKRLLFSDCSRFSGINEVTGYSFGTYEGVSSSFQWLASQISTIIAIYRNTLGSLVEYFASQEYLHCTLDPSQGTLRSSGFGSVASGTLDPFESQLKVSVPPQLDCFIYGVWGPLSWRSR